MNINEVTERIIGCAIEVHRALGPGLLEGAYEEALCVEFELRGLHHARQVPLELAYKGRKIGDYRIDLLVEDLVVVEVKSVDRHDPLFEAQVLIYLRLSSKQVGLLINFNTHLVKNGIKRMIP